jgi:hypothetical protein
MTMGTLKLANLVLNKPKSSTGVPSVNDFIENTSHGLSISRNRGDKAIHFSSGAAADPGKIKGQGSFGVAHVIGRKGKERVEKLTLDPHEVARANNIRGKKIPFVQRIDSVTPVHGTGKRMWRIRGEAIPNLDKHRASAAVQELQSFFESKGDKRDVPVRRLDNYTPSALKEMKQRGLSLDARRIAGGAFGLHRRGHTWADLHRGNVGFDSQDKPKIFDFGAHADLGWGGKPKI